MLILLVLHWRKVLIVPLLHQFYDSSYFKLHFFCSPLKSFFTLFPLWILFPLNGVPFFYKRNKTPTVLFCFSSERPNNLIAERLQYYLFTLSLGNWIFEISRKLSFTKSNAFFVSLIILCFFFKNHSGYRKCTVFHVLFKTNSYFCWLSFLHSV